MYRNIKAVGSFAVRTDRSEIGEMADPASNTAEIIQQFGFKDDDGLHRIKGCAECLGQQPGIYLPSQTMTSDLRLRNFIFIDICCSSNWWTPHTLNRNCKGCFGWGNHFQKLVNNASSRREIAAAMKLNC